MKCYNCGRKISNYTHLCPYCYEKVKKTCWENNCNSKEEELHKSKKENFE